MVEKIFNLPLCYGKIYDEIVFILIFSKLFGNRRLSHSSGTFD